MNIAARILSTRIMIQCEGKPVKHHNLKIGKITGSHCENGQLLIDLTINKKFAEKFKNILSQPNLFSVEIGKKEKII